MREDRYSTPPSESKLRASTADLKASLDELEKSVGGLPLSAPTPRVAVSDEQRAEVCRELRHYWLSGKFIELEQAMNGYEREVKGRMGR